LKLPGDQVPPAGTRLIASEKDVGHITSACFSPALNSPLALAYIRRQHSKPGSRLECDRAPAEVIALPVR
jgi:glycine cleavage system aminomethyltransferase T